VRAIHFRKDRKSCGTLVVCVVRRTVNAGCVRLRNLVVIEIAIDF